MKKLIILVLFTLPFFTFAAKGCDLKAVKVGLVTISQPNGPILATAFLVPIQNVGTAYCPPSKTNITVYKSDWSFYGTWNLNTFGISPGNTHFVMTPFNDNPNGYYFVYGIADIKYQIEEDESNNFVQGRVNVKI